MTKSASSLRILAIEPYYGGSHRAFLDAIVQRSQHQWRIATLPARHWKWRMRSAPLEIMDAVSDCVLKLQPNADRFEVVFVSDMLDLPTWLGFASQNESVWRSIRDAKRVTYFHENQWAYPTASQARTDHHYGFTNWLTAVASHQCWFNSEFNRDSFLSGSFEFLRRMPDGKATRPLASVKQRCRVLSPGFVPPAIASDEKRPHSIERPIRIGWVSRWEMDKRPDRFVEVLNQLERAGVEFELILLGERGRQTEQVTSAMQRYRPRILHDGYAPTDDEFAAQLEKMDVVLSTADHEFFGIAIRQAIWAGAIPVCPNGLAYAEFVPRELRFDSLAEAAQIIQTLTPADSRDRWRADCRASIASDLIDEAVIRIDGALNELVFG